MAGHVPERRLQRTAWHAEVTANSVMDWRERQRAEIRRQQRCGVDYRHYLDPYQLERLDQWRGAEQVISAAATPVDVGAGQPTPLCEPAGIPCRHLRRTILSTGEWCH